MAHVHCDKVVCDDSDHGKSAKVVGEVVQRLVANHRVKLATLVSEYVVESSSTYFWLWSEKTGVVCVLFGPHTENLGQRLSSSSLIVHHAADCNSFQWYARTWVLFSFVKKVQKTNFFVSQSLRQFFCYNGYDAVLTSH